VLGTRSNESRRCHSGRARPLGYHIALRIAPECSILPAKLLTRVRDDLHGSETKRQPGVRDGRLRVQQHHAVDAEAHTAYLDVPLA